MYYKIYIDTKGCIQNKYIVYYTFYDIVYSTNSWESCKHSMRFLSQILVTVLCTFFML